MTRKMPESIAPCVETEFEMTDQDFFRVSQHVGSYLMREWKVSHDSAKQIENNLFEYAREYWSGRESFDHLWVIDLPDYPMPITAIVCQADDGQGD